MGKDKKKGKPQDDGAYKSLPTEEQQLQTQINDDKKEENLADLDKKEQMAREESDALMGLTEKCVILNETTKKAYQIIKDTGPVIDEIEDHIENAENNVETAGNISEDAVKYEKKNRCICSLARKKVMYLIIRIIAFLFGLFLFFLVSYKFKRVFNIV